MPLTLKEIKIFANNPDEVSGNKYLVQVGSLANGSPLATNDAEEIQGADNWGAGLNYILVNSSPPAIQDIDSIHHVITRQLKYLEQRPIPEYNYNTEYFIDSIVDLSVETVPPTRYIYRSKIDNNVGNATSDTTKWQTIDSDSIVVSSSTTATIGSYERYVHFTQTDGTAKAITLPNPSLFVGRKLYISFVLSNYGNNGDEITFTTGTAGQIMGFKTVKFEQTVSAAAATHYVEFIANASAWDIVINSRPCVFSN